MNRPYRARDFRRLIGYIHERTPPAAIGVDTMVGFPGENEGAFLNTFTLIEDLPVSYLHVFPYSPRPGTRAARLPEQVDSRLIKDRAARMRLLGQKKRQAFYHKAVGRVFEIIIEGWESESEQLVRGLSDNYVPVLFHSDRESKNERVSVRVEGVKNNRVLGMWI
jgi:threonylcarbamoyladenosine tRNA methylthiotransferase MtaB